MRPKDLRTRPWAPRQDRDICLFVWDADETSIPRRRWDVLVVETRPKPQSRL